MNIQEALDWASQNFDKQNIPSASLDAEILLCYVINITKVKLIAHPEIELSPKQLHKFKILINQRLSGQPVAYLIKNKAFYNLDFRVDRSVLIPRPETEILVEQAIKIIKNNPYQVADIGTGSGCIAIAIALNCPNVKIDAVDISPSALHNALNNIKSFRLTNINLIPSNLFDNCYQKYDLICANLPYLTASETNKLPYEPRVALFGQSRDGLGLYRQFFAQVPKYLTKNGRIIIEIGDRQNNQIIKIIKKFLPKTKISICQDLAEFSRIVIIKT